MFWKFPMMAIFLFAAVSSHAAGELACFEIFAVRPLFAQVNVPAPELRLEDILSPEDIRSIQNQAGGRRLVLETFRDGDTRFDNLTISILLMGEDGFTSQVLSRLRLIRKNADTIKVMWLNINRVDQTEQGMSLQTFSRAQKNLIGLLKKEGFRYLEADNPVSYLVSSLYRRRGFDPMDLAGEDFYDLMDLRYSQARQYLPKLLQPNSPTQFDQLLDQNLTIFEKISPRELQRGRLISGGGENFAVIVEGHGAPIVILIEPMGFWRRRVPLLWMQSMNPRRGFQFGPNLVLDMN